MGAPKGKPPPPTAASPCACVVLASCLRHACYKGKTTRESRGMTVAERGPPPPPEDNAAGWGGSGERVRDGPHDRAQREHAPCEPQRGGHRGCDRRVGRATTGATRLAPPPPPAQGQVPRLVPAPCSRRAYARGQAARKPPPPPHRLLLHPPTKGARTARRQRGDMGGAEDRPKRRGERRVTSG